MNFTSDQADAAVWRSAALNPVIVAELESVYAYIAAQVESRRPICGQSGRCCRFAEYGHRLYTTGLEAAYTIVRLPTALERDRLEEARRAGGCPFQVANLCGMHDIRPLGCRVYYCDPTAQGWQEELSERMLAGIRRIHERHALPYRYGEWRAMLSMFVP